MQRALFCFLVLLSACGARPETTSGGANSGGGTSSECDACIASGGTWQVGQCTRDCALQDVSCYRDHCPAPCSSSSCGSCEGQDACEGAGCQWNVAGEAMWCTDVAPMTTTS